MKTSLSNRLFLFAAALAVGILGETTVHAQPGGVPLWANHYDGGGNALAVDGSGNVFVTGSSLGNGGAADYATIKYSNQGVLLWTNRYNGPENFVDVATALAVDTNGNVFVTGVSYRTNGITDYATIAYSSLGVPLWTNRHGPAYAQALAVDGSGNVIVTGSGYTTIKYSGAGVPLWTNLYSGQGNYVGQAGAVAVDTNGNVFVTGTSYGTSGYNYSEYATIAYSQTGVPLWTNRYKGLPYSEDSATAIAVDGSGNVFVTGSFYGVSYATLKYSGAGVPLWTNHYGGSSYTAATAIAVDGGGNVFVTGTDGGYTYYTTIKYSNAGVPLWTNRYNGGNRARAMAVDGSGNVFVTGARLEYGSNWLATVAFSNSGVVLWTNSSEYGDATAVAVDRAGNVFVTGSTGVTIKYSSMGGPLLTIARTTTNTLAVYWPSPAAAFTLQQNTNVASTNWTPVGITPADDGTNKTVIVDPPEWDRFYRLFHP